MSSHTPDNSETKQDADDVAIVIPMLNEAAIIPRLLRLLAVLTPAPAEVIAVDGGSHDETVALVRHSGFVRAVEHPVRGRAAAINRGVAEARSLSCACCTPIPFCPTTPSP